MTDSMQDSLDEAARPARVSWLAALRGPFAYRTFAAIWVASLVGNIGGSIQTVAASWLMTSMAPSPTMVSLVQTAFTLPIALFALLSGVAADAWDRRTVMLLSQALMFSVALCLVALAAAGAMTPARLLVCMFVGGCAGAMFQPAWQSAVTEQVPARELSAAIALDSFSMNFARTAGPRWAASSSLPCRRTRRSFSAGCRTRGSSTRCRARFAARRRARPCASASRRCSFKAFAIAAVRAAFAAR